MIITKTPLRIPLAGGGTDLPIFTRRYTGKVISMAINQYIYTYIFKRSETASTIVQTSNLQEVKINEKIKHKLIRETLKYFNVKEKIHIGFFSTMPTRSGIGSSSSLVVGIINSILKFKKITMSKRQISEIAINIERKILNEKGGIQDQISATYGGINLISCYKNFKFKLNKFNIDKKDINFLEKSLILVFSNTKRFSTDIIKSQEKKSIISYLEVKKEVKIIAELIKKRSLKKLGLIFNNHWVRKKKNSSVMTNSKIDKLYNRLSKNSQFHGGKLIGAGGGGFFLFVIKNKKKAVNFLIRNKFEYSEIKIDNIGVRSIKY